MNSRTAPSRKRNKKTNKQRASTIQKHAGPRQEALRRHCGPPLQPRPPHPCGTLSPPSLRPHCSPPSRGTPLPLSGPAQHLEEAVRGTDTHTPHRTTSFPGSPGAPRAQKPRHCMGARPVGTRDPRIALANREGAALQQQPPEAPAGTHRASLSAPTGYSQRPSPRPLSRGPPAPALRPSCARGHGFLRFSAAPSVHPAAPRRRVPWCPHRIRTTYRAAPQPVRVFAALLWVAKLFPGDIYPCLGNVKNNSDIYNEQGDLGDTACLDGCLFQLLLLLYLCYFQKGIRNYCLTNPTIAQPA